jgi:hypothetical protein
VRSAWRLGAPRLVRGCTGGTPWIVDPPREYDEGYRTLALCAVRVAGLTPFSECAAGCHGSRGGRPRRDRRRRPQPGPGVQDPEPPKASTISPQELHAKLDGAPPALAALHARPTDLSRRAQGLQARGARACAATRSSSTCGPRGAARAASSCRSSSARRWTTASAWPSSASTCATTAGARDQAAARDPAHLPVLRGPRRQGRQRLPPGRHAEHDLLRRRGKQTYIHQGQYLDRAQLDADIKRYAASVTEVRPARRRMRTRRPSSCGERCSATSRASAWPPS